jgi:DNA mismatch repair ATPase MutS
VVLFKFQPIIFNEWNVTDLLQTHDGVRSIFVTHFENLAGLDRAKLFKHLGQLIRSDFILSVVKDVCRLRV